MILVTGGTGRVGAQVVRLLRQAKMEVRALVRPGSEYFWLNDTGCNYFFGDLRDATSLRRAARECKHVVHCAGIRVERTENHHAVTTLQGTKDLIDAAVLRGVEHFVFVSCLGAGRDIPNAYFDCLTQAEAHLAASGLDYSIIRPSVLTEEFADIARGLARDEPVRLFGSKPALVSPIAARDVAIYAMAAIDHDAGQNSVLELGGPETMSVEDAVRRACATVGADPSDLDWVSGARGAIAANVARVAGQRWKTWIERRRRMFGGDFAIDSSALHEAFRIPLSGYDEVVGQLANEVRLGEDPSDREERVIHRQFQATVYEQGEILWEDLPEGPLRDPDLDLEV